MKQDFGEGWTQKTAESENEGLKALIRVNNLENREITAYHIGFCSGPLHECQRPAEHSKRALQLLLCREDVKEASVLAEDLKNTQRQPERHDGKRVWNRQWNGGNYFLL